MSLFFPLFSAGLGVLGLFIFGGRAEAAPTSFPLLPTPKLGNVPIVPAPASPILPLSAVGTSTNWTESVTPSSTMSADTARGLIAQGKFSQVKNAKVSKWYNWGDVFVNRTAAEIKTGGSNSQVMRKAQSHAQLIDRLCDKLGRKLSVISWYRPGSKTEHSNGGAVDYGGSRAEHVKIFNAAQQIGWSGGIGMSKPGYTARLHIDSNGQRLGWYYTSSGSPAGNMDWRKAKVTA